MHSCAYEREWWCRLSGESYDYVTGEKLTKKCVDIRTGSECNNFKAKFVPFPESYCHAYMMCLVRQNRPYECKEYVKRTLKFTDEFAKKFVDDVFENFGWENIIKRVDIG